MRFVLVMYDRCSLASAFFNKSLVRNAFHEENR
jgi:hypothetical protein